MTALCCVANVVGKTTERRLANSAYPQTLDVTGSVAGSNARVRRHGVNATGRCRE